MGEFKKRFQKGPWEFRNYNATIDDFHKVVEEAWRSYPKPDSQNKESTPLYWLHKKDEWFVKWFGDDQEQG